MHLNRKSIQKTFIAGVLSVGSLAATPAAAEEVYMIRGFLNVFSDGMNQMTRKLKSQGIRTKAISNGQWSSVAKDIIRRARQKRVSYPIVIVGHSLGGVEAPAFANELGKAGIETSLVIGLDPGFNKPTAFRRGAKQVLNYKIPSGQHYRSGPGFSGNITTINVGNFGVSHVGIDKSARVQNIVIGKIKAKVGK